MAETQVKIIRDWQYRQVRIYLVQDRGTKVDFFYPLSQEEQVANPMWSKIQSKEFDSPALLWDTAPAFLTLQEDMANVLIRALMDDGQRMGMKVNDESALQAELKATKQHLKDLQAIVSKKLGVTL